MAERLVAAGRFLQRRLAAVDAAERAQWCLDNSDAAAAEVGAELGIGRGRASSCMHYGLELLERFPRLAVVVLAGEVDYRVLVAIMFRTALITDPELLAELDEMLAVRAPDWNGVSQEKLIVAIDWYVRDIDPAAVRVARSRDDDRHIEMALSTDGMADLWGSLRAPDAALLDRRLDALAASVCRDDPRTTRQRRADAVAALAAGVHTLACGCDNQDCPARDVPLGNAQVVINLVASADTVASAADTPAVLPGFGAIPADTVRDLAARPGTRVRPVLDPAKFGAEPHYRPSTALAEFIRCRDLHCRFPNCDRPAEIADIDHTVPYPFGPTHPSNLKLLCRRHHLLKTFVTGWNDKQLPDGTIEWTAPTGRTYVTKPGGSLFFPQLATSTGELILLNTPPPTPGRTLLMPTRKTTRTTERANRIRQERAINEAVLAVHPPPPRRKLNF